jgi:hypothetical protein
MMDNIFQDMQARVIVYMDDIIIFAPTKEQHDQTLEEVFERVKKHGLRLKRKKCEFLKDEIAYLGHVVSKEGIAPDPQKTEAINKMPIPENVSAVRTFLGLASYYRHFIPDLSTIASPLHDLTKAKAKFEWTEDCQSAVDRIKQQLTAAPILARPDFNREFEVHTDASDVGMGAVLAQRDDEGQEHVIAYASTKLNSAQQNYSATVKECLAVVWAITDKFSAYIMGRPFKVWTDHSSLRWLINQGSKAKGMIARWRLNFSLGETSDFHETSSMDRAWPLSLTKWSSFLQRGASCGDFGVQSWGVKIGFSTIIS